MEVSCDFNLLFLISDELEHFFLGLNHSDSAPMRSSKSSPSCFVRLFPYGLYVWKKKSPFMACLFTFMEFLLDHRSLFSVVKSAPTS